MNYLRQFNIYPDINYLQVTIMEQITPREYIFRAVQNDETGEDEKEKEHEEEDAEEEEEEGEDEEE
jgi:hypothetical protein